MTPWKAAGGAVAVSLLLSALTASAQPHPTTGVFVQGGAFASIERQPHAEVDPPPGVPAISVDASGTVGGGGLGVGAFVRPFLTVRAEMALPGELDQQLDQIIGVTSTASEVTSRFRDVYVMIGYESDAVRRVRISYLAGAVIRQQRIERIVTFFNPGLPPFVPPRTERFEERIIAYGTSLALGLDAAARVTSRLALVPAVRVAVIGGGLSVRPGVHLRWSF